jgi:hypothetical protein
LKDGLVNDLSKIAIKADLKLENAAPSAYFLDLINSLFETYKSKVVVLIDEYDFPVTTNMDNQKLARANAKVLHNFFSILKKTTAIRFTLVTGITRYALTSMDSGPNHLNDISLDGRYAGICGFTTEEFEPLFADRLEATLVGLKEIGEMDPSDTVENLKEEIHTWYDGYNWGGKTRVLNPYSVLNFFDNKSFSNYWFQSSRPSHLTALMQKKTLNFLDPVKKSYLSEDLRKSDLNNLNPVAVLFHSGYLTLDAIKKVHKINPAPGEIKFDTYYSFRFPNSEVSSSYKRDFFSAVFNIDSDEEDIIQNRNEFLSAIASRDAEKVSAFFFDFLSKIASYQRTKGEKAFHTYIQLILLAHKLRVLPEIPGSTNRLDLCVELDNRVYLIIELKYCPEIFHLSEENLNKALAKTAIKIIPKSIRNAILSKEIEKKLDPDEYEIAISRGGLTDPTEIEIDEILAGSDKDYLTKTEIYRALAEAVKPKLSAKELKEVKKMAVPDVNRTNQKIDDILTKATQKALSGITQKGYHRILDHMASEFIDLGLAIYGFEPKIKAAFGPD